MPKNDDKNCFNIRLESCLEVYDKMGSKEICSYPTTPSSRAPVKSRDGVYKIHPYWVTDTGETCGRAVSHRRKAIRQDGG